MNIGEAKELCTEIAEEGIILLKDFAFNELGFGKDLFDVRKQNKKVLNFHKIK